MSSNRPVSWVFALGLLLNATVKGEEVDFNRDVRSILSNHCLTCHGPDEAERKANLRLDTPEGARADLGGYAAIVPGDSGASELLQRITTGDDEDRMPPSKTGPRLTDDQISVLRRWIDEGADYARHWAYSPPVRPELPPVAELDWVRNPIDRFVLAALEARGDGPSEEADRWALARRVSIDLTGLPPRWESAEAFVRNQDKAAYDRYVDQLLHSDAFGERWARVWLDLARYADSAGYADDPPRTIWGYRDYVIRALNDNLPFDQFTVEQLAGDLLPNPTESQLIATAFHRNTMTNNEGGTNDEQFRNEAIVDRVNTTMQVWMGTTMACAQCHNHKYDPISQEEYFKFFAFFNNTEDSDKRNEAPFISLFTEEQRKRERRWREELAQEEYLLQRPNAVVQAEQRDWEARIRKVPEWLMVDAPMAAAESRSLKVTESGLVKALGERPGKEVYEIRLPVEARAVTAVRLETLAQKENFAVTQVAASWLPEARRSTRARFVRIELPGKQKILSLAEVEVLGEGKNLALKGMARQSSTAFEGDAARAIDGITNGNYYEANSTTHTNTGDEPWWEVDLGESVAIDDVRIWNRTDGGEAIGKRLTGFRVLLLDDERQPVFRVQPGSIPSPELALQLDGARAVPFSEAVADFEQSGFPAVAVLQPEIKPDRAWAVGGQLEKPHQLTLILREPLPREKGTLTLRISQQSRFEKHLIESMRFALTESPEVTEFSRTPEAIRERVLATGAQRTDEDGEVIRQHFLSLSPSLEGVRDRIAALEKKLNEQKPYTTVPVFRELRGEKRRKTHIQVRGNYLNREGEVIEGTPSAFHPLPNGAPMDRLTLARWLVSRDNPLTARVIANRHWEQLFGTGIVTTSEEFGSQGELPSHPELLDWLAVELMDSGWDVKHLLKLIVSSATYRQSSQITDGVLESDPDNRYLGRGPRFRLSAEMIRDQALFIGGLLSDKKFGPPARPLQPELGIKAAFGSGIDWNPSEGADRYRRGLYTNWRRSNPYPSMTTFDAPNREVCTVRRPRSNTPLQALVTLNDPVYVEAAQGFARRIVAQGGDLRAKLAWAMRTALVRPPREVEVERLMELLTDTKRHYDEVPDDARAMATEPLGAPEPGADLATLAAWTVVGNVILNLDELFLKR